MHKLFEEHSTALRQALNDMTAFHDQIEAVVRQLREAFSHGKKVLVAGNGGSAAEAQHFSDEMVGKYRRSDRQAFPAISLAADSAVVTCISNDWSFDHVFRRQVEALGNEGDIFIGLTTSGNSKNILLAAEQAREQGMIVIAFCGQGGALKDMADFVIASPSEKSAVVQELHLHAIHLICEALEVEAIDYQEVPETGDPGLLP